MSGNFSEKAPRVRFAPSPTGPLHIGGVRTALFNYLFAKKFNGTFILRIEDTDQQRFVKGSENYILDSLAWCGIVPDEGVSVGGPFSPYRQSERKEYYLKLAQQLIANKKAYYAFDTPGELETIRSAKEKAGEVFQYDSSVRGTLRNSLSMPDSEVKELLEKDCPYVIRFMMPFNQELKCNDIVRGEITVNTSTLDDKVLFKSDGMPTYHLANVADDYAMEITHVIRGEEWLPSMPLHILLYEAFGWKEKMPLFAHLPLILKPGGSGKLSKRDGDRLGFPVFPLKWTDPQTGEVSIGYREAGYFPEPFVNFLAMLGWSPGSDREIFSINQLIEEFSLERVHKAGAKFDIEKAKWFNHQYIISESIEVIAEGYRQFVAERGISVDPEKLLRICELVRERAYIVSDLWEHSSFFFVRPASYDPKIVSKKWNNDTSKLLEDVITLIKEVDIFIAENISSKIKDYLTENEIPFGNVMIPVRLALVGESKGPDLFSIIELLGKNESVARIKIAIDQLG